MKLYELTISIAFKRKTTVTQKVGDALSVTVV
jgi:hypothetical protein